MPEAVIVATARSPIGRANKGSLKDMRPDDLTVQMVQAALDKVPGPRPARHRRPAARLRPARRGVRQQPGPGRRGAARPRRRARRDDHALLLLLGADHPDGLPRDQGRRGRRSSSAPGSRPSPGSPRAPPTTCPAPATRSSRTPRPAPRPTPPGGQDWHDPRDDGLLPDVYVAMGQTAENVARLRGLSRQGARRVRRTQPEPRREGDRGRLLGQGDHPGDAARRLASPPPTTAPGPESPTRRSPSSSRSSGPTASSTPATAARSTTGPQPW